MQSQALPEQSASTTAATTRPSWSRTRTVASALILTGIIWWPPINGARKSGSLTIAPDDAGPATRSRRDDGRRRRPDVG